MSDIEANATGDGDGTKPERDEANPNLTGAAEEADGQGAPIDPPGGGSPEAGAGSKG
jgi:hypothetical protein